eukprot:11028326-Ditylum_brightwellii.AAC.1
MKVEIDQELTQDPADAQPPIDDETLFLAGEMLGLIFLASTTQCCRHPSLLTPVVTYTTNIVNAPTSKAIG